MVTCRFAPRPLERVDFFGLFGVVRMASVLGPNPRFLVHPKHLLKSMEVLAEPRKEGLDPYCEQSLEQYGKIKQKLVFRTPCGSSCM